MTEVHFESLKDEISILYDEIFKKKIDSLYSLSGENKEKLNNEIKNIEDAYSKGKISELHYNLLNKKIESL